MSKPLTPEEFEAKMKAIFDSVDVDGDKEESHVQADDEMCALLVDLGYLNGVAWFKRMPKWYA